jgi:hypothetical protein
LVWSGARLLLLTDPEPVLPAAASLQVDDLYFGAALEEDLSQDIVSRPVFWQGRAAYTATAESGDSGKPAKPRNSDIDGVTLLGVYSVGDAPGVIVSYKGEQHRLQPDEQIAGWTFTSLNGNAAIFTYDSDTRELSLEHALVAPAPAPKDKRETAPKPKETNKQDKTGE